MGENIKKNKLGWRGKKEKALRKLLVEVYVCALEIYKRCNWGNTTTSHELVGLFLSLTP